MLSYSEIVVLLLAEKKPFNFSFFVNPFQEDVTWTPGVFATFFRKLVFNPPNCYIKWSRQTIYYEKRE